MALCRPSSLPPGEGCDRGEATILLRDGCRQVLARVSLGRAATGSDRQPSSQRGCDRLRGQPSSGRGWTLLLRQSSSWRGCNRCQRHRSSGEGLRQASAATFLLREGLRTTFYSNLCLGGVMTGFEDNLTPQMGCHRPQRQNLLPGERVRRATITTFPEVSQAALP